MGEDWAAEKTAQKRKRKTSSGKIEAQRTKGPASKVSSGDPWKEDSG